MPLEARLLAGLALAMAVVYAATPVAIRVAAHLDFYDRPTGFKAHAAPVPYLGGAAVVTGFALSAGLLAADLTRSLPVLAGVLAMWSLGTFDDRRPVSAAVRLAIEVALGAALWALGLGWSLESGAALDLGVTVVWIVGVVNAFNLFDNMDGAASTMALVVAAGAAALGVGLGDAWLSVVAVALCGALLGFLPHNLGSPGARIFLGDGGSLPVGFAAATLVMIGASAAAPEWQALLIGLLLVGVPALDTGLVVVSRARRGISVLTGGGDHLTHRAHRRLGTARAVAVALGGAQALISAFALLAIDGGSHALVGATLLYLVAFGSTIAVLDIRPGYAPPTQAAPVREGGLGPVPALRADDSPPTTVAGVPAPETTAAGRHLRVVSPRRLLTAALGLAVSLSPFSGGFYDSRVWVPAGLALLVGLTAALIARPPRLSRSALAVLAGLVGLAAWSLASLLWAESIEQAVVEANRYAVHAAAFAVLLALLRDRSDGLWLMGGLVGGGVVVVAIIVVRLLGDAPAELLLAGRLNEPFGYINGQAGYLVLALFPCLALAEQRWSAWLAGAGLGMVALLASLALLTQSRGAALALVAASGMLLIVAPGRLRRAWTLLLATAAVTLASPALLDVYGRVGALKPAEGHAAARAALAAALGAGVVWLVVVWLSGRVPRRLVTPVRQILAGLLAFGLAGVLVFAAVNAGRIADTVQTQVRAFVLLPGPAEAVAPATRLVSGAGNRYDYWRVAFRAWQSAPVLGVGAGNFDRPYFAGRATTEDVRQPHSLQWQALAETGLVGAGLVALLIGGIVVGVARLAGPARRSPGARFLLVAGGGTCAAWLVQTSVDWMHLLPGLTGMGLAGAAVLTMSGEAPRRVSPRIGVAVVVALLIGTAAVSLTRQGLAEHFRTSAQEQLAVRPADALESANRSLRLDSEAVMSYYIKAAALARYGEAEAARATLLQAAEKEPSDFVTWTLLGDLALRRDAIGEARAHYRRALSLNPRDPGLKALVRDPRSQLPSERQ